MKLARKRGNIANQQQRAPSSRLLRQHAVQETREIITRTTRELLRRQLATATRWDNRPSSQLNTSDERSVGFWRASWQPSQTKKSAVATSRHSALPETQPLPANIPAAETYEAWLVWKEGFDFALSVCVPSLSDLLFIQSAVYVNRSRMPEDHSIARTPTIKQGRLEGAWNSEREFADLSHGLNKFSHRASCFVSSSASLFSSLFSSLSMSILMSLSSSLLSVLASCFVSSAARKEQHEASEAMKLMDP